MKIKICSNKVKGHQELLLKQLKGIDVECGCVPDPFIWKNKLLYYKQVLEKELPDEPIVLTDGWDVLFQGTKSELENLIPKDCILATAEMGCHPDASIKDQYPLGENKYRFLNSGGIAGRAKDILDYLDYGLELSKTTPEMLRVDDQGFWTYLFLHQNKDLPPIKLDYQCAIFQALYGVDPQDFFVRDSRAGIFNRVTNTHPQFIHANGSGNFSEENIRIMRLNSR